MSSSPAQRATFRDVFAVREFRALWLSQILSAGGDRLALVALALLIYDRTRLPLLAAIAYAAGTLPYLIGALFLSGMADRFPRREVMVTCDVVRAALVAAMLVPRMPLDVLIALLYAVTAFQPPFDAARSAILRDMVQGERYALAAAIMQSTFLVHGGGGCRGRRPDGGSARRAARAGLRRRHVRGLRAAHQVRRTAPGPPRRRPSPARCVSLAAGYGWCSVTVLCASC